MKEVTVEEILELREELNHYKTDNFWSIYNLYTLINSIRYIDLYIEKLKTDGELIKDQRVARNVCKIVLEAMGKDFSDYIDEELKIGYRIYFNGEKYVYEDFLSDYQDDPFDLSVWMTPNVSINYLAKITELFNDRRKNSVSEFSGKSPHIVKKCELCGRYFRITKYDIGVLGLSEDEKHCKKCRENKEDGVK